MANDALLTRLFIRTLDEVTFEWFPKLPEGSIKSWTDLEKLFLLRFYETNSEVTIHTLLALKQTGDKASSAFVVRFQTTTYRMKGYTPHDDLVAIYRCNLKINVVRKMGGR